MFSWAKRTLSSIDVSALSHQTARRCPNYCLSHRPSCHHEVPLVWYDAPIVVEPEKNTSQLGVLQSRRLAQGRLWVVEVTFAFAGFQDLSKSSSTSFWESSILLVFRAMLY